MLRKTEARAVETAISRFLRAHRAQPFDILREVGTVAAIRSELVATGVWRESVKIALTEKAPLVRGPRYEHKNADALRSSRVQLEVTVVDGTWRKTIDIGLLTRTPTLQLGRNGPGDVLEQIGPASLAVAIEVKASPSVDPAQRGLYVEDLLALFRLSKRHRIQAHFVLLDRSQTLYGHWSTPTGKRPIRWSAEVRQEVAFKRKDSPTKTMRSLGACGLEVALKRPPLGTPYVHLWMLDPVTLRPVCRFVTLRRVPRALRSMLKLR
jgi:hypothetical protein